MWEQVTYFLVLSFFLIFLLLFWYCVCGICSCQLLHILHEKTEYKPINKYFSTLEVLHQLQMLCIYHFKAPLDTLVFWPLRFWGRLYTTAIFVCQGMHSVFFLHFHFCLFHSNWRADLSLRALHAIPSYAKSFNSSVKQSLHQCGGTFLKRRPNAEQLRMLITVKSASPCILRVPEAGSWVLRSHTSSQNVPIRRKLGRDFKNVFALQYMYLLILLCRTFLECPLCIWQSQKGVWGGSDIIILHFIPMVTTTREYADENNPHVARAWTPAAGALNGV